MGKRVLAILLLAGLVLGAADASAKKRRRPVVNVHILTLTQQEAKQARALRVELRSKKSANIRMHGLIREGGERTIIAPTREVHVRRGKRVNLRLSLNAAGRKRLARNCHTLRIWVVARARGSGHHRAAVDDRKLPSTKRCGGGGSGGNNGGGGGSGGGGGGGGGGSGGGGGGSGGGSGGGGNIPFTYTVGLASRSIAPEPDGMWRGAKVYLGGYGISGGQPGGLDQGRAANGVLAGGPRVRAFALSDGKHPFAFANLEVQGWFVANKDAPYGLVDMRKEVARRTGGAVKADEVMIQSNHSHGGADPMGVWGNVPLSFRKFMYDQTVAAILDAWQHRKPANLYYGWAPGRDLQSNQFDYDESNKAMDSDVRVLQARGSNDKPIATILDFSSHPTVLGSSNRHITGDWSQRANELMQQRFGGDAMTILGTLGRTQPNRASCPTSDKSDSDPDAAVCKLDEYANRVVDRAADALEDARLLGGDPAVSAKTYLIQDPADNGVVYVGLGAAGDPVGVKLDRALTPPWLQGNVLGTVTGSVRIGDVLLSAVPGEIYPQIALRVAEGIDGPVRKHGFMTAGLANDQLGYIIYPYRSYPEPILSTFVSRGDQIPSPDPIGNDNYAFNVSKTLGGRVVCSLLRGAGEAFGKGTKFRDANSECVQFPNDMVFAEGEDVRFPQP